MSQSDERWWSDAPVREPSARERVTRARRTIAGLMVVAALVAASVLLRDVMPQRGAAALTPATALPADDGPVLAQAPAPPPEPAPEAVAPSTRLLPVATPPPGEGGYTLATFEPGASPARFDPCRPIEVRVNPAGAPPGWKPLVEEALEAASTASGLSMRLEGTTAERPSPEREAVQLRRYGNRWAPVLIAWTDGQTIPGLSGGVLGLGGPTLYGTNPNPLLVTGFVYLDGPDLARKSTDLTGPVLAHELGHLLGLDHVDDPAQLMYPRVRADVPHYRDGDLRGLADAGSGRCATSR